MRGVLAALILCFVVGAAQASCNPASQTCVGYVNIKAPAFGATGNNSTDDTAAIQAAMDYASNNGLTGVYCPAGNYKTTAPLYLDPPGNLRSNLSNPTMFQFSLSFFGDPAAGGTLPGCRIRPTFNNAVALYVGTGQGMRVSDIAVIGPSTQYRGQQSSSGVGIGLTGGTGGSSVNLVENTYVADFYALYETDANGACCLNDSNTFRKVSGDNGYFGINFAGTQTDINDVVEPRLAATVGIASTASRQVNVYGGNISAGSGRNASFGISSISAFTKTADGNGFDYTFTATIASPDANINTVYNAYMIVTSHFGIVPMTLAAWNSGTSVGTFKLLPAWVFANYDTIDMTASTDIQAEIAAASTIYAAEQVTVAEGDGIVLQGQHIENPNACMNLMHIEAGFAGATSNEIRTPYFNADPSVPGGTANLLCQESFPFIAEDISSANHLYLNGGNYNIAVGNSVIIDYKPEAFISGENLDGFQASFRLTDSGGFSYSPGNSLGQYANQMFGIGRWDNNYFIMRSGGTGLAEMTLGEIATEYCGYIPCSESSPNLTPSVFAQVCPSASGAPNYTCGALGALRSYPPISGRTIYKMIDFNSGTITYPFVRSASNPLFSWGQNLTTALVGGTIAWSYKGQSNVLYVDSQTIQYLFPGLGIGLPDPTSGTDYYVVTGVFAQASPPYVTVIADSPSGGLLAGVKTTVYSCSSSCTIGQNAFAWSAYQ